MTQQKSLDERVSGAVAAAVALSGIEAEQRIAEPRVPRSVLPAVLGAMALAGGMGYRGSRSFDHRRENDAREGRNNADAAKRLEAAIAKRQRKARRRMPNKPTGPESHGANPTPSSQNANTTSVAVSRAEDRTT